MLVESQRNDVNKADFEQRLNILDTQVTEIVRGMEKQNSNRMPNTEWSIEVHQVSLQYKVWSKIKKAKIHGYDIELFIAKLMKQLQQPTADAIQSIIRTACPQQELKKLIKYKKELVKHATKLRSEGLKALISIREAEGKTIQLKSLKKIRAKENSKRDWKILEHYFNNDIKSGLNYVDVPFHDKEGNPTNDPDKADTWQCISDPEAMEQKIIERNIKHFGQAQGTVFTDGPLQQLFQYEGAGNNVDLLLNGEIQESSIETTDIGIKTLLQKLSSGNKLDQFNESISFDDFINALKKWKERTSTSPSGRHLGHYKVLFANDFSDKYDDTYEDPKLKILQVYYSIASAAMYQGISLTRWQTVVTSMIKKAAGCSKINKLRVIHLYEADYNLLLKILWARRLVWNAHTQDRFNSGQSGSRPGCNAIDNVVSKEMKYLYGRLLRTALATMDNDAKSCYDRIICNLAMIVSQYFGMSTRACQMQATTLRKMQFRLRTAIGDSTSSYCHSETTPIHGTGQGSCASPAIWLTISSIFVDCLSDLAGGMTMKNVTDDFDLIQWMNGFVDDTSLFCNLQMDANDVSAIKEKLRNDMIIWQSLLEASGGKLELSKCFYYILTWHFDSEGNPIADSIEQQRQTISQIKIPIINSALQVNIEQKEPGDAHKTLGCYKTLTGCEKVQIKQLQDKAHQFGSNAKNSKMSRKQARMAYNSKYIPSLRYGLPSCSISKTDMDKIQHYPVEQFLSKMGYEQKFPRAIVFAHQDFGGLNLPNLYSEMMGSKVETLIAHIQADSELGKAFLININTLQLLSGISEPIFKSTKNLQFLDNNWLLHLRSFINEINGKIYIKSAWRHELQRSNDVFLMDEFLKLGYSNKELRLLHNWRVFFQVNTLADICEPAEQNKIQTYYLTRPSCSEMLVKKNSSKLFWPTQQEPGIKGFKLWMNAIKVAFQLDKSTSRIKQQLGSWTEYHHLYNTWNHYYDPSMYTSYHIHNNVTTIRNIQNVRRLSGQCDTISFIVEEAISSSSIPAAMISKRNIDYIHFVHSKPQDLCQSISTVTDDAETYREFVKSLPTWKQALVKYAVLTTNKLSFLNSIAKHNRIIIATDGGTHHESGTFGVIISNTEQVLATNRGKLYANHFYQSAFRSEFQAILAGIITIEALLLYHNVTFATINTIEIICDNKKVVQRLQQRRQVKRTTNQHTLSSVDIEMQILESILLLEPTTNIIINHIPGHQDKNKQLSELSYNAILNIEAHRVCLDGRTTQQETYHVYPTSNINMTIENAFVHARYAKIVKRSYHSITARLFYQKKYLWSNITINLVWWLPHASSLRKLYIDDRVVIQKFLHNRLPTNKRQNYRHIFKCNKCTNCSLIVETENHIIQCQTYSRQQLRKAWIIELSNYLSKSHTPVLIKDAIITNLTKWLEIGKYIALPKNDETNNNNHHINNNNEVVNIETNNNNNNNNHNVEVNNSITNNNHNQTHTSIENENNNNNDYENDNDDDYNDYDNDAYNNYDNNNNDDDNNHDNGDNYHTNNKQLLKPKDYLAETIIIQNRIGWNNFIRGRLAVKWGNMINIHLTTINYNKKFTAETWATNIIDVNFSNILTFWATRNLEEHGKTDDEIENNKIKRLLEEVRFIMASMHSCTVKDRQYLPETIEELESKSSRHLELWLTSARILQQTLRREAKSRTIKGNSQQQKQQLDHYYPITTNNNNTSTSTTINNNIEQRVDEESGSAAEQSASAQTNLATSINNNASIEILRAEQGVPVLGPQAIQLLANAG